MMKNTYGPAAVEKKLIKFWTLLPRIQLNRWPHLQRIFNIGWRKLVHFIKTTFLLFFFYWVVVKTFYFRKKKYSKIYIELKITSYLENFLVLFFSFFEYNIFIRFLICIELQKQRESVLIYNIVCKKKLKILVYNFIFKRINYILSIQIFLLSSTLFFLSN